MRVGVVHEGVGGAQREWEVRDSPFSNYYSHDGFSHVGQVERYDRTKDYWSAAQ